MRKIIFGASVLLMALVLFLACSKEQQGPLTQKEVAAPPVTEKSNTCFCMASGLWNSCFITCPKDRFGVCLANCFVGGWMGLGMANCTCGTAGVRLVADENIVFDEVNVENLNYLKALIVNYQTPHFEELRNATDGVLAVVESPDGALKAERFNTFFAALEALNNDEKDLILPDLREKAIACGRAA